MDNKLSEARDRQTEQAIAGMRRACEAYESAVQPSEIATAAYALFLCSRELLRLWQRTQEKKG